MRAGCRPPLLSLIPVRRATYRSAPFLVLSILKVCLVYPREGRVVAKKKKKTPFLGRGPTDKSWSGWCRLGEVCRLVTYAEMLTC